ncbi:hypothetical protein Scani_14410 [Streptomyces caniferus]|uniref:Uncharacterized protein n=1 Tax=Streptomyces caniferus TaxID=285557 RepID=A0A640S177_9ACTN|nr:hypothetical protein Scani_14410 [Streptomyces caniferus]
MPRRVQLFADIRSHTDNTWPYTGKNDLHRSTAIGQYRHKARTSARQGSTIPVPLRDRFAAKERALSDPRITFEGTAVL